MADLQSRILSILEPCVNQIAELVRIEARQELGRQLLGQTPQPEQLKLEPSPTPSPSAAKPSKQRTSARLIPTHCIFPECKNPSKGPRFTFMCEEHYGASKKDKAKYLAAWKSNQT